MMNLFIKTLTGTIFELRVSPFETILSIKSKLQRLEGISISQQHLIWQTTELNDEFCLHDYEIRDGTTLTMVLAMRDGPINMRRVSVEEPSFQEMADYMSSNVGADDDLWDKIMNDDKQVTLLVFRDGDQLNFFRVYDRGDGIVSPYSDRISPETIYNGLTEEDSLVADKKRLEDNAVTRDKMILLRNRLKEKIDLKKLETYPQLPPRTGKPNSVLAKRRIQFSKPPTSLSRHSVIPKTESKLDVFDGTPSPDKNLLSFSRTESSRQTLPAVQKSNNSVKVDVTDFRSSDNQESGRKTSSSYQSDMAECATERSFPTAGRDSIISNFGGYTKLPSLSGNRTEPEKCNSHSPYESSSTRSRHRILKPLGKIERRDSILKTPPIATNMTPPYNFDDVLQESQLSDMLRDTVDFENYKKLLRWVQPKPSHNSKEYTNNQTRKKTSARGRNTPDKRPSAAKIHPHGNLTHLPSLQTTVKRHPPSLTGKKKPRCSICTKKLGLATTYQCRCGGKYCATHRYPETHTCTYDYKTEGRKLLEQNNPVVTASKLPKI